MKTTLVWLTACLLLVVRSVNAQEQPENRRHVLAEELLVQTGMPGALEQASTGMKQAVPAQVKRMQEAAAEDSGLDVNSDKAAELAKTTSAQVLDLISQELSWNNVKREYISMYSEMFTEEQLKDAIAFFKSPSGRAFVKRQPEMVKQSGELIQKHMRDLVPRLEALCKQNFSPTANGSKKDTPKKSENIPLSGKYSSPNFSLVFEDGKCYCLNGTSKERVETKYLIKKGKVYIAPIVPKGEKMTRNVWVVYTIKEKSLESSHVEDMDTGDVFYKEKKPRIILTKQ